MKNKKEYEFMMIFLGIVVLILGVTLGITLQQREVLQKESKIGIINGSKEHTISVWSRNGELVPSKNKIFKKLNELISYSNSEEWRLYAYTSEGKYYIDRKEVPLKELLANETGDLK